IDESHVKDYLSTVELSGVGEKHLYNVNMILKWYLNAVGYNIKKESTIEYLRKFKNSKSVAHYRKVLYQIKKFLEYYNVAWASTIKPPKDTVYKPQRVTDDDIKKALEYFKGNKSELRYKTLIKLGVDSGLRPEEMYQLRPQDIDLDNNTVYVNHKPEINQYTKTKESRVSFFTDTTKEVLSDYLKVFNNGVGYGHLFGQSDIQRAFRGCNIKVKMLRKYFSQKWTRNNGNYQVKEMLMGHSLKKSIDSQHYCCMSNEEIKTVYDKVMS
ncbi:site-specific integrase, partial [Candidatus Woesearchaeota archaeon]|nr:site-specific integrase [Candidatus Woesearchaeota archaeon]